MFYPLNYGDKHSWYIIRLRQGFGETRAEEVRFELTQPLRVNGFRDRPDSHSLHSSPLNTLHSLLYTKVCAPGQSRTDNRQLRKLMLYPLSYRRIQLNTEYLILNTFY